jgi:hypothetical protein
MVCAEKSEVQFAIIPEVAMADKSNDPVAMWHNLLGEMEKGFSAFANQAMAAPEFSKVGRASAGTQNQVGELMESYLTSMNLPSRAQLTDFGERLQAIEGQLSEITALLRQVCNNTGTSDGASAPKPPRGKRPASPAKPK